MSQVSKLVWRRDETPEELFDLLDTLGEEYPVVDGGRGLKLKFRRIEAEGTVSRVIRSTGEVLVEYNSVAAAARGVGSALAKLEGEETTPFKMLGIMLDVSRNMVMKVDHLKLWFRRLSLSGYNLVMLYTEDTYQLPGEPFFGYMRGGYSIDEIKELDAYAKKLGIELVGCIQTLGHLEQIIRWHGAYGKISDTAKVLMVDEPKTYELIDKMIAFWSEALDSRRIHIGMDETHDLGRGKFIDYHGFEAPFELFNRHLGKVNEICKKHGVAPLIWSDMYFRLSNPEQNYYDFTSPIPESVQKKIPKNVQLVYWDYYNDRQEHYTDFIEGHRQFGRLPIVASGIWTWSKLWYDHHKTRSTVPPCVNACRQTGVRELIFTMWGDDGGFCHWESASAGLAFAAECVYHTEPDNTRIARRFKAVAAADYGLVTRISAMEGYHRLADGYEFRVRAAVLLYDDPLLRIALRGYRQAIPEVAAERHAVFLRLLEELKTAGSRSGEINLDLARAVLTALERKMYYHLELDAAWPVRDRKRLARLSREVLPELAAAIEAYAAELRREWLKAARPFGLEVQQIRLAGAVARARETALRIDEFLSGSIPTIPELEAAPEPPWPYEPIPYAQVATASSIL